VAAKSSARFAELNKAKRPANTAVNKTVKPILWAVLRTELRTKMVKTGRVDATMTAITLLALSSLESEYDRNWASSSMILPAWNRRPRRRWNRKAMRYVIKWLKGSPSERGGFTVT
jgi:hypothetical protein